jgi:CHAD domain-containing protein
MSIAVSLPTGVTAKITGLEVWMNAVLERSDDLRPHWNADDVHDVRVALRRCRTMGDALRQVYPDPGWRKLKRATKELFHSLGDLRDAQVEQDWIRKLGAPGDAVRQHLLRVLGRREKECRQAAEAALDRFDRKAWRKLVRKLPAKARFFPLESVVFQRQALASLNEAVALYQKARKNPSSVAWHRTRIGIKRFRYVVENFLPHRYEVWASDMKQMQDLLGEVHDLDVLRGDVRRESARLAPAEVTLWLKRIAAERKRRLAQFGLKTSGQNSPWVVWPAGFQGGHALVAATIPQTRAAAYAS